MALAHSAEMSSPPLYYTGLLGLLLKPSTLHLGKLQEPEPPDSLGKNTCLMFPDFAHYSREFYSREKEERGRNTVAEAQQTGSLFLQQHSTGLLGKVIASHDSLGDLPSRSRPARGS